MTDGNKTHGYYIVKLYSTPQKFQEDTGIYQAGDVIFNTTHLTSIHQSHHWYTQSTIKTVVRVQHVITENNDF